MISGKTLSKGWKNSIFDRPWRRQYLTFMDRVPLFPLGLVLLPRMPLPLHIFEERYRVMFDYCIREDQPFGVILQTGRTLRTVGCLAQIENIINRYDDGRLDVLTVGTERFVLENRHATKPYLEGDIRILHDEAAEPDQLSRLEHLSRKAVMELEEFARVSGYTLDSNVITNLDYEELSFLMATTDIFSMGERQDFLEMTCTATRFERASRALDRSRKQRTMMLEIREFLGKPEAEDLSYLFN